MRSSTRWRDVTPYLLYCTFFFAWGDLLFGLDTGSFASIQSLPSFLSEIGEPTAKGTYVLSTSRKSIMNSIVFSGKLLGTMSFEPMVERIGYKWTIYVVCAVQSVAVIIQMTSHEWVQFTIGRIVAYYGVGLVENAVPSYQAEIAPASLRGFISGSLICLATLGAMWGAGMGQAMSGYTTRAGWLIPVGVQMIPPAILVLSVPFTVESPRWLVLHNKKAQALQNLNRLRPKNMVENGATAAEIDAIDYAIESSHAEKQGSWLDLFRGTYLRRTIICSLLFWFHESTGQQFVNSYGPTFFKQIGLGSAAFTYSLIAQACGVAGALICILVVDRVGRRPILIAGQALAALFNFLVAGYGSKLHPTTAQGNLVIASIILLFTACKFSVNTLAFLAVAEIGGVKMRKKILSFATSVDVLSAFIVTFCIPYLLGHPGANLGPKLGWLLGGDSILAVIFAVFFFPELAGRSLEEVDELFEARLWAWQFKSYQTSGIGRRIAVLEEHHHANEKVIMVEQVENLGHDKQVPPPAA